MTAPAKNGRNFGLGSGKLPTLLPMVKNSVRRKLMLMVLTITFTSLLVMASAMVVFDLRSYHTSLTDDLMAQANLLGRSSAAALEFDDPKAARENLALLKKTGLRIATLPMPAPVWFDGQRLPASYANFYIANGLVLVPVFNDPMDRIALTTLAKLFPTRQIVPIYSRDLVLGLGTLHCMTMQQPTA